MYSFWRLLTYQRRYILKFATDGAVLTNTKTAVQASMRLIPADVNGKVMMTQNYPDYLDKEITLYYYIGTLWLSKVNEKNQITWYFAMSD